MLGPNSLKICSDDRENGDTHDEREHGSMEKQKQHEELQDAETFF